MTSIQKVIKYLAIALAIFLIVTITSAILSGIYALSSVLGLRKNESKVSIEQLNEVMITDKKINELEIDIISSDITIKTGDILKIETNNSNIKYSENNEKLSIEEEMHNWFVSEDNNEMIIYIPKNLEFEKVIINAGAGKIDIEDLSAKELKFELGAGETKIHNLEISKNCKLDGGAGNIEIESGKINNLNLDMGVGQVTIKSKLTGNIDIDAGVGNLDIEVNGNENDYRTKIDKGLGSIKINGKETSDNQTIGNGNNEIDIDGGVGNISIKFID